MNNPEFNFAAMTAALRDAARAFPFCRIANCECNSIAGEWKAGCGCMCHFLQMDEKFGKDKWTLNEFSKQSEIGL